MKKNNEMKMMTGRKPPSKLLPDAIKILKKAKNLSDHTVFQADCVMHCK